MKEPAVFPSEAHQSVAIILGIISIAGGFFLLFLGYEVIRTKGVDMAAPGESPKSLAKGVAANALSPYPYLFWISVGTPTMVRATPWAPLHPSSS